MVLPQTLSSEKCLRNKDEHWSFMGICTSFGPPTDNKTSWRLSRIVAQKSLPSTHMPTKSIWHGCNRASRNGRSRVSLSLEELHSTLRRSDTTYRPAQPNLSKREAPRKFPRSLASLTPSCISGTL